MRMKTLGLLLAAALVFVAPAAFAAVVWDISVGTAAPPGTLGGYAMTAFPLDPQPAGGTPVSSVASPLGGVVDFTAPDTMAHYTIGAGWATWSHGYTGDVYYTGGALSSAFSLPAGTGAFYFYAEPNPFSPFLITATTGTGESTSQMVDGLSGASFFGVYGTGGSTIASITVSSGVDFAVGEFGIAAAKPVETPEPSSLGLLALGALALVLRRRKV